MEISEFKLPHEHGEYNIEGIRGVLARVDDFSTVADVFAQLGDPTRIRIFWLLCHRELCVTNIAALLDMSSPAVFHHLRSLHESGLITSRREGKEVHYRIADKAECELLHRTMETVMTMACPRNEDSTATPRDIAQRVHDHMVEHLSERITINELSRIFLINPTSLKEAFREEYGTPIAAHIKQHRMEKAAELLASTENSIADIAIKVGYESQSRFSTAFKEQYGVLPTEYRKSVGEQ